MGKKSRLRRAVTWCVGWFSLLVFLAILVSLGWRVAWSTGYHSQRDRWGLTVSIAGGRAVVQYNYGTPGQPPNGAVSVRPGWLVHYYGPRETWRFFWRSGAREFFWFTVEDSRDRPNAFGKVGIGPNHWIVAVPLWVPLLVFFLPTLYLWRKERRPLPGHCRKCGYDLTGNESGVCPECGQTT